MTAMTFFLPRRLAPLLVSAALRASPALLPLALLLAACDAGDGGGSGPPPGDEIVEGVNLDALFRTPSVPEQDAVRAAWAARDQGLDARYAFSFVEERTGLDGAALQVYRARDAQSGEVLFHGVVRRPVRPPGDVERRPLVLVLPDGDGGASAGLLSPGALPLYTPEHEDYVYALLAYRGTPLTVAGTRYDSAVPQSSYDLDVEDALAFLRFARDLGAPVPVDPQRVGVLGVGRGGGTALLTEARTDLYDVVVALAGPSDLFLRTFRNRVRALLQGHPPDDFPGIGAIAEEVVYPLRDGALTVEEARFELLRRSPFYFTGPPPFIAVAHGTEDRVVPVDHGRALYLTLVGPGGATTGAYLEVEGVGHAGLTQQSEVAGFVSEHLRTSLGR